MGSPDLLHEYIQIKIYNQFPIDFIIFHMEIFDKKIRGFHAKSVENIMMRSLGSFNSRGKAKKQNPTLDNITTYLKKFEVDRQNLNLAKRILQCESEHSRNKYKRDWKKTKIFLKVRSNFKRNFCNQQPRIYKFQKISGQGKILVTFQINYVEETHLKFKEQSVYQLKVMSKNSAITPTNSFFTLQSIKSNVMAFYISGFQKKKKMIGRIFQIRQNEIYEKGKFGIELCECGQQTETMVNKVGKAVGSIGFRINICSSGADNELISLKNNGLVKSVDSTLIQ